MSDIAEAWAAEQTLGSLTAMKLLATLGRSADEHGVCDLSQTELAARVGVSERTVRKHLVTCAELRLLSRLERYGLNGKRMNDLIFLDLTTGRLPEDHRKTTGRPPEVGTYIKSINTHTRAREPSLNFPANVDPERFDLLMDVALERGKLLSHTQKQTILNKLAVVQQYEDANHVLDLMIQKAWFGVDVNYWKLRKEKSSARPARRAKPPDKPVTPTSGVVAPATGRALTSASNSAAPGNEHVADPERAAAERKNAERKRAAEREQTELLNDLTAAGVDFKQADSHAASLYGALLVGDVARAEQVRVLARRCVLEAQKTALARDGP